MNNTFKKTIISKAIALSCLSFMALSTAAHADTITIQAEDFSNYGGTFDDGQPNPITVHSVAGGSAISYVNAGDFIDYNITTNGGEYSVEYLVGTSMATSPGIEFLVNINGNWVSQDIVTVPQGSWDNFQPLKSTHLVTLPTGASTIRLHALGSNWQWNLDSFSLNQETPINNGTTDNVADNTDASTPDTAGVIHLEDPIAIPANLKIEKSSVWFTYPQNSQLPAFSDFGATGAFWGHMPEEHIDDSAVVSNWANLVQNYRNQGLDYVARGEFDWGFRWFIDYVGDPTAHWARTLDDQIITMTFMGNLNYKGYPNGWMSNHSPTFVDYYKTQVDALLSANVSHIMFDSQTSSTRTTDLNQFGGDFSTWSMDGFRNYMRDKYTSAELAAKGISNINNFNYKNFLVSAGYTHATYMAAANRISSGIPLFDDFIYFNRDVLNEKMGEVLDYIRSINATIEVGATTALSEARGYIFDKNISFLAGELAMASTVTDEMPIPIITHLKNAEAVDKTLVYFPYPFDFKNLYDRNSPALARTWIAQSYAMGAIFSIPANIWIGDAGVWSPNADNYRDIYQFADANSNLLDGYDAFSNVGLVSPMMASLDATWIDGSGVLQTSIRYLIENNLNFDLLPFGDPGRAFVPTQEKLNSLSTIIVDADRSYLTAEQNALLNANSTKVLDLSSNADAAAINALKANNISVTVNNTAADATVTALSRVHESNNNAPYVVQLLNRPVNPTNGVTPIINNVKIAIPQSYFPETLTQATVHLPGASSVNADITSNANGDYVITVNNLGVWGIIELAH